MKILQLIITGLILLIKLFPEIPVTPPVLELGMDPVLKLGVGRKYPSPLKPP